MAEPLELPARPSVRAVVLLTDELALRDAEEIFEMFRIDSVSVEASAGDLDCCRTEIEPGHRAVFNQTELAEHGRAFSADAVVTFEHRS